VILKTKHQSQTAAIVEVAQIPVESGVIFGSVAEGSYTDYFDATQSSYWSEYIVTTNADDYENLNPELLDLSDWPTVRRQAEVTSGTGVVSFNRNGIKTRRSFNVSTFGQPQVFRICDAVLPSNLLSYCHNLIFPAAEASGKNDFYYRAIGGSGVSMRTGTAYLSAQPNPDCWAAQWDFSGVPIWNSSTNGARHGGALISKNSTHAHLIEAKHYASPVGTVFKFMTPGGVIRMATSIGVARYPVGATNAETEHLNALVGDRRVHVLSGDLTGCAAYPLVGSWAGPNAVAGTPTPSRQWELSGAEIDRPVVCVWLDQYRKAKFVGAYGRDCLTETTGSAEGVIYGESVSVGASRFSLTGLLDFSDFTTALLATGRYQSGVSQDSGSAVFVPLSSSALALATCWLSPMSGPSPDETIINLMIADADAVAGISTGLTVTVAPDPTAP